MKAILKAGILWMIHQCSCFVLFAQAGDTVRIPWIPAPLVWQNKPQHFSVSGSSMRIRSRGKTDWFRDPNGGYFTNSATQLLFLPAADFVLVASIEHAFAAKWDGGAIILSEDSLHWVKFCFEKDYTGAHRVVTVVTNGISDDCNSVSLKANKVYYKMARAGDVITLYYSVNGRSWFLVRHFPFHAGKPVQAGFLAQSPEGPGCEVIFSDILYSEKKIKDPYLGE